MVGTSFEVDSRK